MTGFRFMWRPAACAVVLGGTLLVGCATQPAPVEELGATRAAIQTALAEGANNASPEMALARDKLARAEAAAQRRDAVTARRLAEEATVDAQVARARIEAEKSRKAAAELDASLAALRDEMNRSSAVGTSPVK
jgi:hypothetical protein